MLLTASSESLGSDGASVGVSLIQNIFRKSGEAVVHPL